MLWVSHLGIFAGECCECQKFMGSKGTSIGLWGEKAGGGY